MSPTALTLDHLRRNGFLVEQSTGRHKHAPRWMLYRQARRKCLLCGTYLTRQCRSLRERNYCDGCGYRLAILDTDGGF